MLIITGKMFRSAGVYSEASVSFDKPSNNKYSTAMNFTENAQMYSVFPQNST